MFRYIRIAVAVGAVALAAGTGPRMMAAQDPPVDVQAAAQDQPGDAAGADLTNDVYLVQMSDAPVLTYEGGVAGRPATKRAGHRQKIDVDDPDVRSYAQYLDARHDQAVRRSGGRKLYGYRYSFNGFAAQLSPGEANALANTDGVLRVVKDELRTVEGSSWNWREFARPGGMWDRLAGPERAGEDIIIGVIDSGITPESLSFTDREDKKGVPSASGSRVVYDDMRRWRYRCQSGEQFSTKNCNNKLIGAQRFNAAWGGDVGIKAIMPWEYASPRDFAGHGTHTASIAGGNYGVPVTGDAAVLGSTISGIAPRARIAVYKATWARTMDGSIRPQGFDSDLVAAIEKAVADGVDVINFSVGGTKSNFAHPIEIAFRNAAAAGVFVATSAGNEGPTEGTVQHPSPWVTTVANATPSRNQVGTASVSLGNGKTVTGASLATGISVPTSLYDAAFAGSAQCEAGLLDPAVVSGKIVICDRSNLANYTALDQSRALKGLGAAGMILVSPTSPVNTLNPDFHFVPTVVLSVADGNVVRQYFQAAGQGGGARATISRATVVEQEATPTVANSSSRGPLVAGDGDLLKPDLIAPGTRILAATSPAGNLGRSFTLDSGTSMSAPHVAGMAALLMHLKRVDGDRDHDHGRDDDDDDRGRGRDRDWDWDWDRRGGHDWDNDDEGWSPMMIKSALMTTAIDVVMPDAGTETDITPCANAECESMFAQGAGQIDPARLMDPGLVFDSDEADWAAFMCGSAPEAVASWKCWWLDRLGFSFDASDLNVPSIAIGDLPGEQTVTRTVTNVGHSRTTYRAIVSGMDGIEVKVSPAMFTVRPGRSKTIKVTFKRTTALLNMYTGGHLTLTDGNHDVRVPMVVRPIHFEAPADVFSAGESISYPVKFGFTGPFAATMRGLFPATINAGTVTDDPGDFFFPGPGSPAVRVRVTVPAGTTSARFSLSDADVASGADLDLQVYRGSTRVGFSATRGTSNEEVILTSLGGTTSLDVYVHGFAVNTVNKTSPFKLHTWLLSDTAASNVTITAPSEAVGGQSGNIELTFNGLQAGQKYLGSVAYTGPDGTELSSPTMVRVDVPAGQ
jgi:hypothetical protein